MKRPMKGGLILGLAIFLMGLAVAFTLSHKPPGEPPALADSYIVPGDIPSDCSVNVSVPLNRWLATVPDNTTALFNGGCYRIDQTLVIHGRAGLTIDGGGATFKAMDPTGDDSTLAAPSRLARTRSQWDVSASDDVTIQNMSVIGANPGGGIRDAAYVPALEAQHGFNIDGDNRNIDIHDVTVSYVYGDCVYFRGTTNGHFHDSRCGFTGRQGVSVTSGGPVAITNNLIGQVRHSSIDLEPGPGALVHDVLVDHNTFGLSRLNLVSAHGAGVVNAVTITGNTTSDNLRIDVAGSPTSRRGDWVVTGNTSSSIWGAPAPAGVFLFAYVDRITVQGNSQKLQAGRGDVGVQLIAAADAKVTNNSFINGAAVYTTDSQTSAVLACNNQLTATGRFDQPNPCASHNGERP